MNRYITLDSSKKVISVRYGKSIVGAETQSNSGDIGQIRQADGSFSNPEPTPIEPQPYEPTNSEVAQMISDLQADLIIAGVI